VSRTTKTPPSARHAAAGASDAGLAARRVALEILLRVEKESAFADVLLGKRIVSFSPPDRRLVTRLVLGTLAWRGRLDYELAHLSSRPLEKLTAEALAAMRLGLFQLRFLTRVPKHAAVDTAVSIVKEIPEAERAAGFVNAVLRRASAERVPMPRREDDEIGYLATVCSHPRWLAERLVRWFGAADAESLMTANNEAAPNAIRLNLARGSREAILSQLSGEGFEIAREGRLPEALILKGAPRFDSESYRAGLFHAQSEASQLVSRMLKPATGAIAVDCAAAPGGKATHLAEMVGPSGRIIALDRNFAGVRKARALAGRLGHRNLAFVCADMITAPPLRPESFRSVLVDAPCTGLGTLREHPEIRWRLGSGDIVRMAAIQARMLEGASSLVQRSGGALVYAVCSIAPEEGKEIISHFLTRHPEFKLDRHPPLAGRAREMLADNGMLVTRPDRDEMDGFFAARLIRQ
jgi:16S rRNA (cytosine967-C5)-methyltransferase